MKIGGKTEYLLSLESVSMTDIVLNMFLFFFISFSLLYTFSPQRVQKLEVKLPQAQNTRSIDELNQVFISLTNEGVIYLGDDVVSSLKELKAKVSRRREETANLAVILRADRLVNFKKVVEVLDLLAELGITNLNIAAIKD